MPASRRSRWLKLALVPLALAVMAVLFVRTLDESRSEPFTVREAHLTGWSIVENRDAAPGQPLLLLSPPAELPLRLFRQVFTRAGESLTTPNLPGVWLVMADELGAAPVSVDELLTLAREAGLDQARMVPRCMVHRRESQPGATRQLYFVWFELPELSRFRQAVAERVMSSGASAFNPDALQPVMMLAAAPDFTRWMPLDPVSEQECLAGVEVE